MNLDLNAQILKNNLRDILKASEWLNRSFAQCSSFRNEVDLSEEQLDAFEALSGRFARASDMLVNKVFRSLDRIELERDGTPLDVLGRAHKRKLFDDLESMKIIRSVRNAVAHDYTVEDIKKLFVDLMKYTPVLLEAIERTIKYCEKKKY